LLVYEFKVKAKAQQDQAIDEAIRIGQFLRNKCLRYWMDSTKENKVNGYALNKYTKVLADNKEDFPFVCNLNSMARQACAERAWLAISRFFENCKNKIKGKKGFPRFKKNSRSVEYKTSGWKLSEDRKYLTITDKTGIGTLKLVGTIDLHFYAIKQIKRVRLLRKADGYYAQFCINQERLEDCSPTNNYLGLDVGLESFYTDSEGRKVENPRFLRKYERKLKRLQRSLSRKKKGSKNRTRATKKLGKQHLKVSRQRKDWVVKLARCVMKSNDFVAIEDLNVKGMVKNHQLAKSISDASWSLFRQWLEYFAQIFQRQLVVVAPHYTSAHCSGCGQSVQKSLSTRTHICQCGLVLCRDHNAAINILKKALDVVGHTKSQNACGQINLCVANENLLGKLAG
jgi:putative transposase